MSGSHSLSAKSKVSVLVSSSNFFTRSRCILLRSWSSAIRQTCSPFIYEKIVVDQATYPPFREPVAETDSRFHQFVNLFLSIQCHLIFLRCHWRLIFLIYFEYICTLHRGMLCYAMQYKFHLISLRCHLKLSLKIYFLLYMYKIKTISPCYSMQYKTKTTSSWYTM